MKRSQVPGASGESPVVGPRRRTAFWVAGATLTLFSSATSAPSPLYGVYQLRLGFSATVLTAIFAVYAVALLVTLLPAAELSDHVGRRPVIIVGLALQMVAMVLFLIAHEVTVLVAARVLQGISVGIVLGALSAVLVDLQDHGSTLGPLVGSVAGPLGLAAGALLAGELVEYAAHPLRTIYWLLLALFAVATVAVLAFVPETSSRGTRHRLVLAFKPRIPPRARRCFFALTPVIAIWALAGLYLSLGPSLTVSLLGIRSDVVGALVPTTLCGAMAAASVLSRAWATRPAVLGGSLLVAFGVAITVVGIDGSAFALFLGCAIAGLGFGAAFAGAFRTLTPLAEPDERGSLIAALYLIGYIALGVPTVLAGLAVVRYGLRDTATVYAFIVIALALAAALAATSALNAPSTSRKDNQC